jgi:hypothetical protein
MPKISVSDHHANLLVDFFRQQEKELTEKLSGIRTVLSELLGEAAKAVAPKSTAKRGRKPNAAKAALDLLANAAPKPKGKRGRPKGATSKSVAAKKVSTGKRGRPSKKAIESTAVTA